MSKLPTPEAYRQYPSIWTPSPQPENGFLLIRHPNLSELLLTQYLELMQLRFECLLQNWMAANGESQVQTHSLLLQSLRQLSNQEAPQPEEDLWSWAMAWGETLIQHNETVYQQLKQQSSNLNFPIQIPPKTPEEQSRLQLLHDEMTLSEWLSELTQERLS